jgi:hypothetical protein
MVVVRVEKSMVKVEALRLERGSEVLRFEAGYDLFAIEL